VPCPCDNAGSPVTYCSSATLGLAKGSTSSKSACSCFSFIVRRRLEPRASRRRARRRCALLLRAPDALGDGRCARVALTAASTPTPRGVGETFREGRTQSADPNVPTSFLADRPHDAHGALQRPGALPQTTHACLEVQAKFQRAVHSRCAEGRVSAVAASDTLRVTTASRTAGKSAALCLHPRI
jgi:hypothetical protein